MEQSAISWKMVDFFKPNYRKEKEKGLRLALATFRNLFECTYVCQKVQIKSTVINKFL